MRIDSSFGFEIGICSFLKETLSFEEMVAKKERPLGLMGRDSFSI